MACRLPGGVDSPQRLWQALLRGDDFIGEIPADRWDADLYYDPEPGVPGRSVSRWGAFLDDVGGFDCDFFGLTEREATAIDPQHRLLLETSWDAIEHAGLDPATLAAIADRRVCRLDPRRLRAAVRRLRRGGGALRVHRHLQQLRVRPGVLHARAARPRVHRGYRVFVRVDGRAPSLRQPGRRRERPRPRRRRGRDTRAAEVYCGIAAGHAVAHRPLPCLRCRGRRIHFRRGLRGAVAQAVGRRAARRRSHPGRRPRYRGQSGWPHPQHRGAVERGASRRVPQGAGRAAGVDPATVGMVEAHGTGTPVGDPVEYASLAAVYGTEGACALASVKTNFGHMQSTSGALGMMKAILALEHGVVPQNLHFNRLPEQLADDPHRTLRPAGQHALADQRPPPAARRGVVVRDVGHQCARRPGTSTGAGTPTSLLPGPRMRPLLFPISATSAEQLRVTAAAAGGVGGRTRQRDERRHRFARPGLHAGAPPRPPAGARHGAGEQLR